MKKTLSLNSTHLAEITFNPQNKPTHLALFQKGYGEEGVAFPAQEIYLGPVAVSELILALSTPPPATSEVQPSA